MLYLTRKNSVTNKQSAFGGQSTVLAQTLLDFTKTFPDIYNLYYPAKSNCTNELSPGVDYDIYMKIMSEPASRIYSGVKKYELRKYVPKHTGLIFLLENEVKAVTGCFYFNSFITKTIEELWEIVGEKATTKEKFDSYFSEKKFGVALHIKDFQKFQNPITLEELYGNCDGFPRLPHPYVYLYTPVGGKLSSLLRREAREILERLGI